MWEKWKSWFSQKGEKGGKRKQPEDSFIVTFDEERVSCQTSNGIQTILWEQLTQVSIQTTSEGPWLPDVWWILSDGSNICLVPQGAPGEDLLRDRLMTLPEFQFGQMIKAMGCAQDAIFVCWQNKTSIA